MKKLKIYWSNFVGKVLAKLSKLFTQFYKNWELKRKEENFREGTKRMLEIVDYMEKRSVSKSLKDNATSRVTINEANNKLSVNFNDMRSRIISIESATRDNVADPVVDRLLEKLKELPLENTDPAEDLAHANPHMMTDDKFVELLENLKSQNVIAKKKTIPINY